LKINWLHGVIRFNSNNVGALGHVYIVSQFYQSSFGFSGSNFDLNCGLRDHEVRTSWYQSLDPLIRLYPFVNFVFFLLFCVKSTCFYQCFCFGSVFSNPKCLLTFFIIISIVLGSVIKKIKRIGWIFCFLSSLKTYSRKKMQNEYYNQDYMYFDEVLW
jgi:hypothetical protein